jgi:ribonuclease G
MKKILINKNPWQTRVAIVEDSKLENIYFEAYDEEPLERTFIKGIVTAVLPGIQTAFVDIGQERAGFLHISEVDRELAMKRIAEFSLLGEQEELQKKSPSSKGQLSVEKIFTEGEAILVQVSKEPVYEKGAKLTTCYTLPGRFIVLMPNISRLGISKKIESRNERIRLKEIVKQLLPEGMGAIIRTTAENRSSKELAKDINFVISTWNTIQQKYTQAKQKEKIHEDLEISLQVVRDHLDSDVEEVLTDDKANQQAIYNFIKLIAPEFRQRVKLYDKAISIFNYFGIEKQINALLDKKVALKSGGSLIIETTEAMTVIDVNTGRFIGKRSLEETILKTNLEASEEIVRQLRLRNIGGLIVIDFIDMVEASNRQHLFNFFERMLKEHDKYQSVVLKVSEFGLLQMTRKRTGKTLIQKLTQTCPICKGSGFIKSVATESYTVLQKLKETLVTKKIGDKVNLTLNPQIFDYLTTIQYNSILQLEKEYKCKITLITNEKFETHHYKIEKI